MPTLGGVKFSFWMLFLSIKQWMLVKVKILWSESHLDYSMQIALLFFQLSRLYISAFIFSFTRYKSKPVSLWNGNGSFLLHHGTHAVSESNMCFSWGASYAVIAACNFAYVFLAVIFICLTFSFTEYNNQLVFLPYRAMLASSFSLHPELVEYKSLYEFLRSLSRLLLIFFIYIVLRSYYSLYIIIDMFWTINNFRWFFCKWNWLPAQMLSETFVRKWPHLLWHCFLLNQRFSMLHCET